MIVKLLTEHHLHFLSLKGGCRGSSESTIFKMSNCWKSHASAHTQVLKFIITAVQSTKYIPYLMLGYIGGIGGHY